MKNFLVRWIITAIAVSFVMFLVPGISIPNADDTWVGITVFSLFLALINVSIKPLLQILSLPISILTLGLFALVVNTALFYLAAWCCTNLFSIPVYIASFGTAFIASILVSIVTGIVSSMANLND